jgi:hypothetical protein
MHSKRPIFCFLLVQVVFFSFGLAFAAPNQSAAPGYLTINRLPTVGGGVGAFISIDGLFVARIGWGQSYRGPIAPGDHLISITRHPYNMNPAPAEKRIRVESGQSYMLTLKWGGAGLILN